MARPTFPSIGDLPSIAPEDATRALAALRHLVREGICDVYTASGSNDQRWNVWDSLAWMRIPLGEWAQRWLALQDQHRQRQEGGAE